MSKRNPGEGTIFQRGDGLWVGTISLGFGPDGKRQRKTVYGKTSAEVQDKLESLKQQRKHGLRSVVGKDTLAAYLQSWLDDDVILNKARKTYQEYEGAVRKYVVPFLGNHKLNSLTGEILIGWQARLARSKHSANTRLRSIRILRCALNRAVRLRLITLNPCAVLTKPRVVRKQTVPLELDQCHRLIAACQGHRLGDAIIVAAMTGLRKGELFALEWSAVNLSESVLVVRRSLEETDRLRLKEPKTSAGRRVVSLGAEAVAALRRRLEKAVDEGFEPGQVPIVFPNTLAGHLRGSNFDRTCWYPIRAAAGIADTFVFHDLRHTQASLMLAAGVDLKVIQKRLGHRDFATTANIYSHLLQGAQPEAVDKVDRMMARQAPKNT